MYTKLGNGHAYNLAEVLLFSAPFNDEVSTASSVSGTVSSAGSMAAVPHCSAQLTDLVYVKLTIGSSLRLVYPSIPAKLHSYPGSVAQAWPKAQRLQ